MPNAFNSLSYVSYTVKFIHLSVQPRFFGIFTELRNNHYSKWRNIFSTPQNKGHTSSPHLTQSQATTNLLSASIDLLILDIFCMEIIESMALLPENRTQRGWSCPRSQASPWDRLPSEGPWLCAGRNSRSCHRKVKESLFRDIHIPHELLSKGESGAAVWGHLRS